MLSSLIVLEALLMLVFVKVGIFLGTDSILTEFFSIVFLFFEKFIVEEILLDLLLIT